jgi:NAD+ kinase
MLRVDPHNPRAAALHERLSAFLDEERISEEVCLVVGGDGWMLSCIRELGAAPIYLGLNAGQLGFLLNDVSDPADVAAAIAEGAWRVQGFPRLEMEAWDPGARLISAVAVNDLYVERRTGQVAHLSVKVDGQQVVERLVCDGLLVATALGSTAYTFSAGGALCHPLVRALLLTPICPHSPRLSPMVLPMESRVEVEVLSADRRPVRAVADGVDHGPVVRMAAGCAVGQDIRLAFLADTNRTRTLIRKVLRS